MTNDALDYLMSSGAPTAKFPTIGTTVRGQIISYEKTQQTDLDGRPKFYDDGNPMWQIVFTVQTDERDPSIDDDDGARRIFAKSEMLKAIRKAVQESGHKGDLVGGTLAVQYQADGTPPKPGYNAPKLFGAAFGPPTQTADLLGAGPAASPAPTTPAAQGPALAGQPSSAPAPTTSIV